MSVPAAYIAVIVIWSTTPLAVQWSTEGVGFVFGATARMTLGALLCVLLVLALRVRLPWHSAARRCYAAAALGLYGCMIGVYWAVQYVPSGLVAVLFGITPLIAGVLAALLLGERTLTPLRALGVVIGVAGLALIFGADLTGYPHAGAGITVLLGAVAVYSLSMVLVKRSGAALHPLAQTTGGLLVALPCYLLTWLLIDGGHWPQAIPARTGLAILYLAVLGSVVGFLCYFYALKHLPTAAVALVSLITPVLALQLGSVANAEHVPPEVWLGTAVVLVGLAVYQWGPALASRFGPRRGPVL